MKNEERLQNLEIKIAYIEKSLEDLNDSVVAQDRVLDDLRKEISAMRKSLEEEEPLPEPFEPTRE